MAEWMGMSAAQREDVAAAWAAAEAEVDQAAADKKSETRGVVFRVCGLGVGPHAAVDEAAADTQRKRDSSPGREWRGCGERLLNLTVKDG